MPRRLALSRRHAAWAELPGADGGPRAASERIARAIRAGERIVVFGDYDVDGTTSAVILSEVIARSAATCATLIADRFTGDTA